MSNVPRLLKALRRTGVPPRITGVVHDFASTRKGHNLTITAIQDEGLRIRASCWVGRRPRAGDQVVMRGGDGQTARYRVLDAEKAPGVDDMYYLNLLFDPRVHKGTGGIHVG